MELDTFITKVLRQISKGITDVTNEKKSFTISDNVRWMGPEEGSFPIDYIDFDVNLTEQPDTDGVSVLLSSNGKQTEHTNVKFRVPIYWDVNETRKKDKSDADKQVKKEDKKS